MNLLIVQASRTVDPTTVANLTGAVSSISTAPRLATGDLSQLAWIPVDVDDAGLTQLTADLRSIIGDAGVVTRVVVGAAPPAAAPAQWEEPGLQYGRQRGSIAI